VVFAKVAFERHEEDGQQHQPQTQAQDIHGKARQVRL
jgi:hypothetical protein